MEHEPIQRTPVTGVATSADSPDRAGRDTRSSTPNRHAQSFLIRVWNEDAAEEAQDVRLFVRNLATGEETLLSRAAQLPQVLLHAMQSATAPDLTESTRWPAEQSL